jgi:hypothetical protein
MKCVEVEPAMSESGLPVEGLAALAFDVVESR